MKVIKQFFFMTILMGSTCLSACWNHTASLRETEAFLKILEACGTGVFDPCHPDPTWPICLPGESWSRDMCVGPTCRNGHIVTLGIGCTLSRLPPEIGELGYLLHLDLFGDQLTGLPPEIGRLVNLTSLDLSGTRIVSLPKEIGQLVQLQNLVVYVGSLESLPREIGRLSNLENLNLFQNHLTGLPEEIGQLTKLKRLDLSGNQISELPPEIGRLESLEYLNLGGNQLISLPPEIGRLESLEYLDLSGNALTDLPPEIGQLAHLKHLYLNDNHLSMLPAEIGQLEELEDMNLSANQLTSLPDEMGDLIHLRSLDIHDNPLNGPFPSFFSHLSLEALHASVTGLCIPDDVRFQNWPFGMEKCSEMIELPDAEKEALLSLYEQYGKAGAWNPEVPPCRWLGVNCWNGDVRNLQLSDHGIKYFPTEITRLAQLEYLDLESNALHVLTGMNRLVNLKWLSLKNNLLHNIPPEISQLINLVFLDVSDNPIVGPFPDFLKELLLVDFYFDNTGLCIPDEPSFGSWWKSLAGHSSAMTCKE